ncbi:hypothetical protein AAHE18_19G189600 [Arachis hypogaea]
MYILFCPVVLWNHELPLTYDFHNYMLKSMDDEFRDIVGVSETEGRWNSWTCSLCSGYAKS